MNEEITYSFLNGYDEFWEDNPPVVIKVCNCDQCKANRNKRSSKKVKKRIKRLLNKRRRGDKYDGRAFCYYWS